VLKWHTLTRTLQVRRHVHRDAQVRGLIAGPFANLFKIELAAKNADPNYGVCWLNRFGAKKAIDNANEDEKLPLAPWH
jgi:hypothetical protein